MADFRRLVLFLTIGCFSVAALLGVIALLGGGDFGDTEARVLLTTLLVGVTSVAVLCYLATAGSDHAVVGLVGAGSAIPTLLIGLALVWGDDWDEGIWQAFGVGTTVSATLAQASLLLTLAATAEPYVRRLLAVTLVAATWVCLHVSGLIIDLDASDGGLRLLGVVAILDVLGTVAVAALAKFGGSEQGPRGRLEVPQDLAERVTARARAAGRDTETELRSLLESAMDYGRR
jgi:hypothetical protein